jgi:hypothetical protein
MTARFLATWFLAVFAALGAAAGDDWYVDNISGSDRNAGNEAERPLQTIQAALLRTRPGDRVILKKSDLPYREQISIMGANNSGFNGRPLEIVGNGAVLDGTEEIPGTAWEQIGADLFQFRPRRLSHQLLYLDGRPLEKFPSSRDHSTELKPLQWTQRDGWIVVRTEPGKAPYQYKFACCDRTVGITLYEAHDVLITDLTIQGFQLDGVNAHDRVHQAQIAGCVLRGNGRSGVSIGGAAQVALSSNLIGDNGQSQVRTEGYCRLAIDSCDILEQPGRLPVDQQGGVIVRDGTESR